MKIRAKYPEYPQKPSAIQKKASKQEFEGNFAVKKETAIDNILKAKFAQKLFKIANDNPHVFNLITIGTLGMTLRPATLLVVPGAEKEDKQYVAAKSIVGTALLIASELLVCIPLGKTIDKLGKAAETNPKLSIPKFGTKQFKAYSFLVNNAVGLALTLALSSFLTVKLTAKIMNKLFPSTDKNPTQKPSRKEREKL